MSDEDSSSDGDMDDSSEADTNSSGKVGAKGEIAKAEGVLRSNSSYMSLGD